MTVCFPTHVFYVHYMFLDSWELCCWWKLLLYILHNHFSKCMYSFYTRFGKSNIVTVAQM